MLLCFVLVELLRRRQAPRLRRLHLNLHAREGGHDAIERFEVARACVAAQQDHHIQTAEREHEEVCLLRDAPPLQTQPARVARSVGARRRGDEGGRERLQEGDKRRR